MSALPPPILVDGHVHFHPCFDLSTFFDSAHTNFEAATRGLGFAGSPVGCLMFAESAGHDYFRRFREHPEAFSLTGWQLERTEEETSLVARSRDGRCLFLIAGRQVVMRGRLEVLALATDGWLPDGGEIDDTLAAVHAAGGLVVLPWGFGKWWLGRGARVRAAVLAAWPFEIFLGDNGGRSTWLPEPRPFAMARSKDIGILPGSDPLPIRDHNDRAGSYGFCLEGELSQTCPAADLTDLIRAVRTPVRAFGRRQGILRFCRDQLLMQVLHFGAVR